MLSSRPMLEMRERSQLQHPLIALGADRRGIVSETIHEVCGHRGWELHALAVRTEHVHVVIGAPADTAPEAMMVTLKAWATRRMVERRALAPRVRAWSRHGSTRYLWTPEGVASACRYVIDGQGEDLPVSRP
jgi:REP element-mobilizing transposase RayT